MKYKQYKNIVASNLDDLDNKVNDLIKKGCSPVGGLSTLQNSNGVYYIQTVNSSNPNEALGELGTLPGYIAEVRMLAKTQKLAAVKLYMNNTGLGLREAKDWVDNNC